MTMFRVLALDLSLTATGLCWIVDGKVHTLRTLETARRGHARLWEILHEVARYTRQHPHLTVIEGPSYRSKSQSQRGHHERAGLWWLITHQLWASQYPYAVVPPASRAKYATGRGNAGKKEVLEATDRRYRHLIRPKDHNQADALILAALAMHHLRHPLAAVTPTHAAALNGVDWPELPSDEGE